MKSERSISAITRHGRSCRSRSVPPLKSSMRLNCAKYREAEEALQRWQDSGETIDYKGWQKALKYLNTERMVLDIDLREMKEDVRRLEVVKREYIKENKKIMPDRYGR